MESHLNRATVRPRRAKPATARTDKQRSALEIGRVPRLRVIDIGSLLLHEEPDPRRFASLRARIASDGCLKNPPVAARDHGESPHVLLDGVNRVLALKAIGLRRVVVQEVDIDDPHLVLSTWHHVVEGIEVEKLIQAISSRSELRRQTVELTEGGDFVPRFDAHTAYLIVTSSGAVNAVCASAETVAALDAIREVVATASAAGTVDRVSYTNLSDLAEHYPALSAFICYRKFSKHDVIALAGRGMMFPSGVTKFNVPKRVLSLMVPLSLLDGREDVRKTQEVLDALVLERVRSTKIRFYEEPTFYFDD